MSEIRWIKITTDILNDAKIQLIDAMPDADGIFRVWIGLLTLAGRTNDCGKIYLSPGIPYTDEMLAAVLHRNVTLIRMALKVFENYKMIEIFDSGEIAVLNWGKHQSVDKLDRIKEQARYRQISYRERQKNGGGKNCNVTVTSHNAPRIKNKNKNKNINTCVFDEIWSRYPVKRGSKKAALAAFMARINDGISADDLGRAVDNYALYCRGREIRHILHGSTFFGPQERWAEFVAGVPDDHKKFNGVTDAKKTGDDAARREYADFQDWLTIKYGPIAEPGQVDGWPADFNEKRELAQFRAERMRNGHGISV